LGIFSYCLPFIRLDACERVFGLGEMMSNE